MWNRAAIGLLAGRFAAAERRGEAIVPPPPTTAHGALLAHITGGHIETIDAGPSSFQPMNVNFGLFPPLRETPTYDAPEQARPRRRKSAWRVKARFPAGRLPISNAGSRASRRRWPQNNVSRQSAAAILPRARCAIAAATAAPQADGTGHSHSAPSPSATAVTAPTTKRPAGRSRKSRHSAICDRCLRARKRSSASAARNSAVACMA